MSTLLSAWPGVVDTSLEVGGRRVRVLRADSDRADGGGEPQLLVHGLGGSSVTWIEIMAGLGKHGPVVAVDLPGFGRTPARDEDALTVRGYVEFVVDVADALGWDRFALHGNSMGGLIAVLLAARHPERVARLVLVSPALPPRTPLGLLVPARATVDGMAPVAVSTFSAAVLGVVGIAGPELTEHRNRQLLKLIYADPDGVDRAVLQLLAADFTGDDATMTRSRRRALRSATRSIAALWTDPRRVWRAIDRVTAPTLVLGGTRDALVPAKVLRAVLARRPDWTGRVLDDRRHALMMEDPATYLEELARWRDATGRAA
jgi:pimeloyl-ACP methyl ester carboxylesterase